MTWCARRRRHHAGHRDLVRGGAAFAPDGGARTATGVVFEDRSGTGRRQAGDPGIAGVLVSNGREVVKTDGEGRYALPVDDETIIFVIKPTGYAVPVERGVMLPRFYYIHQPQGTPAQLGLRYRGIAPSGPLPGSVDFALRKVDEPSRFDVLMFTDPHAGSPAEIDFIRDDVVNPLIGTKAAFGLTTGDIMSDDLSLYGRYNRIIGQLGVPWHNIVGNHDLNLDAPDGRYSRETFKQTFGPSHYAFEYGGALFLMLDNVDYFGARAGEPELPIPGPLRQAAARLRGQCAGGDAGGPAGGGGHAYSAAHLSRARRPGQQHGRMAPRSSSSWATARRSASRAICTPPSIIISAARSAIRGGRRIIIT